MSMQWLLAKAPEFQALPESDCTEIFNFTFLWSLFEAQVMGKFARADLICAKVDEWRDAGTLEADQYAPELTYFQQRYFDNGAFTYHFSHAYHPSFEVLAGEIRENFTIATTAGAYLLGSLVIVDAFRCMRATTYRSDGSPIGIETLVVCHIEPPRHAVALMQKKSGWKKPASTSACKTNIALNTTPS